MSFPQPLTSSFWQKISVVVVPSAAVQVHVTLVVVSLHLPEELVMLRHRGTSAHVYSFDPTVMFQVSVVAYQHI